MSYYIGADGPVTVGARDACVTRLRAVFNVESAAVHVTFFSVNHVIFIVDIVTGIDNVFEVLDLAIAELPPYNFKYISSSI